MDQRCELIMHNLETHRYRIVKTSHGSIRSEEWVIDVLLKHHRVKGVFLGVVGLKIKEFVRVLGVPMVCLLLCVHLVVE